MTNEDRYLADLGEIKNIMHRSTRFISLSGWSGILAGIYALIGAYVAWGLLYDYQAYFDRAMIGFVSSRTLIYLAADGLLVFGASLTTGWVFTYLKARKDQRSLWDPAARRLLINLFIPLLTGAAFLFMLLLKGYVGLIAPGMLIFYGLALVNASKYTFSHIRYLGFIEIAIGLVATLNMGFGLFYWALGFGLMHILYGIIMYFKLER